MIARFNKELAVLGLQVPVKEISNTQKALGDYLIILPRFKCVKAIEGDEAKKCVLFKAEGREVIEKYASDNGLKVTEEKVIMNYDNFNMSKSNKTE